jgi:hypothetical protein
MFSNSPFSAAPFSSLEENLVEAGATLDAFCILDLSSIIKLISSQASEFNVYSDLYSSINSRYLSNIELNASSVLDSSSIIKSYIQSFLPVESYIYNDSFIRFNNSTILNNEGLISASTLIKTHGDLLLSNEVQFLSNYLNKIHSDQTLEAKSAVAFDSFIKNFNSSELLVQSDLVPIGKIKFYADANTIDNESNIYFYPNIKIQSTVLLEGESDLISNYLNRTIGYINLQAQGDFSSSSYIKNFNESILNVESDIISQLGIKYFNTANFECVALFKCNLSQRNQDVVYYILNEKTSKSFTLNIMRVKV